MPARYFEQTLPDSSTRFRMVHIPGGTFLMGSAKDTPEADEREYPQHEVTLSDFWMGEYPVTQAFWEEVIGYSEGYFKGKKRPVEEVGWNDAAVFCNRLSQLVGLEPVYRKTGGGVYGISDAGLWDLSSVDEGYVNLPASGYRLPTEAEWEYAARGGPYNAGNYIYAGSDLSDQAGWCNNNSNEEGTKEVGLLLPNKLGIYDLSGNVWE